MDRRELEEKTEKLLMEGRLEDAFLELKRIASGIGDGSLENDTVLQISILRRNNRDYLNGLITREDVNRSISKQSFALNQLIDRLPKLIDPEEDSEDSEIRVLFLSSNPKTTAVLRLNDELRKIKDVLLSATQRHRFFLSSEPSVSVSTITRALQVNKPQIVHFSGHGKGDSGIVVEGDEGTEIDFPTIGLARLFRSFKPCIECVVLNACLSEAQARVISEQGIYAVGMGSAIGDRSAIDFAAGFYQSLGEGNDYEFAFNMALVGLSVNEKYLGVPEIWLDGKKLDF